MQASSTSMTGPPALLKSGVVCSVCSSQGGGIVWLSRSTGQRLAFAQGLAAPAVVPASGDAFVVSSEKTLTAYALAPGTPPRIVAGKASALAAAPLAVAYLASARVSAQDTAEADGGGGADPAPVVCYAAVASEDGLKVDVLRVEVGKAPAKVFAVGAASKPLSAKAKAKAAKSHSPSKLKTSWVGLAAVSGRGAAEAVALVTRSGVTAARTATRSAKPVELLFPKATNPASALALAAQSGDVVTGHASGEIFVWHRLLDTEAPHWAAAAKAAKKTGKGGKGGKNKAGDSDAAGPSASSLVVCASLPHWHSHAVLTLALSEDGGLLLSGGEEAVLVVWQTKAGSGGERTYLPRLGAPVVGAALAAQGAHSSTGVVACAVATADNCLKMVEAGSLRRLWEARGAALAPPRGTVDVAAQVWRLGPVESAAEGGRVMLNGDPGKLQLCVVARRLCWCWCWCCCARVLVLLLLLRLR